MITIKESLYKVIKVLFLIITLMIAGCFILMINAIDKLQNDYKELNLNYTNLNEKVNRIKADLIIQNEYK